MGVEETKHDLMLKRINIALAIVGGVCAVAVGVYNVKKAYFTKNVPEPAPMKVASQAPPAENPLRSAVEDVGASWIRKLGKAKTDTGQ